MPSSPPPSSPPPPLSRHLHLAIQLKDDPPAYNITHTTTPRPRSIRSKPLFPSPPVPTADHTPTSALLPSLPEPLFLPSPYSPSHPAFQALASRAERYLDEHQSELLTEIDRFLKEKRDQWEELQEEVKKEVGDIWEEFEGLMEDAKGTATSSDVGHRLSVDTKRSFNVAAQLSPTQPSKQQGFLPSKDSSSSLASLPSLATAQPKRTSSATHSMASMPSPSPTTPSFAGPSLLGVSLRNSYMPTRPAPSTPLPPSILSPSSPPLENAISRQPTGTASDKDLATSLLVSNWAAPPNLIFRESTVNAPETEVPTEPVSARPEKEDGGLKEVLEHEPEMKKVGKRVAFREPEMGKGEEKSDGQEDEDEESESRVESEPEDVFDFEPPLPHADFAPEEPLVDSTQSRSTSPGPSPGRDQADNKGEGEEPMYALDGSQSWVPVSSSMGGRGEGERSQEREQKDGESKRVDQVAVSVGKLTAANLPSHRAALKDKDKKWRVYGRLAPGSGSNTEDPDTVLHYGQSLPIAITLPPTTHHTGPSKELERKTSLADREMFVPPLRKAIRKEVSSTPLVGFPKRTDQQAGERVHAGPSPIPESPPSTPPPTRSNTSSSPLSSMVSPNRTKSAKTRPAYLGRTSSTQVMPLDPGPMLEEEEGDSDQQGFVAPYLKRGSVAQEVGWASLIDR